MSVTDSDPRLMPAPVRIAEPLFSAFVRSHHCGESQRWHARASLPVLALFVAMEAEFDEDGLSWGSLSPDALMSTALDADHDELGFLIDLLDVSSAFYAFLGDVGVVPFATADRIHARLATLALGLSAPLAA